MGAHVLKGFVSAEQADMFDAAESLPTGFRYCPGLFTGAEQSALAHELGRLTFEPFDFHGYLANRRVAGFGYRYDYSSRTLRAAAPIPSFLAPLRERIALFAGAPAAAFEQVLINEYLPGAGIGWHRDKAHFDMVVGVSLLAPCRLRFRRKTTDGWDRRSPMIAPGSAYLLTGPARHVWEHSIPPLDQHRYSITLRTLAGASA